MTAAAGPDSSRAAALPRLRTGNAELDTILDGGFPARSINIILGEPGSGKTILVEQLMFANVGSDRPILYVTTLSEPLDKVVRYLQQLDFFDDEQLASGVVYEALGEALAEGGIETLVPRIREAIKEHRPKMIVIDSFKAVHDLAPSVPSMRRMLYQLAGLLTAYDTTVFLVGEYGPDQIATYPEFAVADGMIELARNRLGGRDERFLRVHKLRGSRYAEGLHAFDIGSGGLTIFPRLVSPNAPPAYDVLAERVPTGIEGLDALLDGGLHRGRSVFLLGPTGSGKTTLGLQFALEGVRRGERALYVSFEENPSQLEVQVRALAGDGFDPHARGLHTMYASPVELRIDTIVAEIFKTIVEHDIRRLVVDAVGDLVTAAGDPQRLHGYLYALAQHFAVRGVTSIFPYELQPGTPDRLSALSDVIVHLGVELVGRRARRTLRVAKARGIGHDLDTHELVLGPRGAVVS